MGTARPVDPEGLLVGAYDLHVHASPDRRPRRLDVWDLAQQYVAGGMAGAVLKDHFLPTAGRCYVLNRAMPTFRAYSTCVLNASVGGLNPEAVASSLDEGVTWVFMPTISSQHHLNYGHQTAGYVSSGISIYNSVGRLRDEVHEILELLEGRDVVLASGHLSPQETYDLFTEAQRRGIVRNVVTHASAQLIQMPVEMQRELAAIGVTIEHTYVSCLLETGRVGLDDVWSQMLEVGLGSCYLATDLGQSRFATPLEGLATAIAELQVLGATQHDVRELVATTPHNLVCDL